MKNEKGKGNKGNKGKDRAERLPASNKKLFWKTLRNKNKTWEDAMVAAGIDDDVATALIEHKAMFVSQLRQESEATATALPVESKKAFWKAMANDDKTFLEAQEIAGIDDDIVAACLALQLHDTILYPKTIDDIT